MRSKVKAVRLKGWLLEWAEDLKTGEFSYHVKEALRLYLSGQSSNVKPVDLKPIKFNIKKIKADMSVNELEERLNNF